jgi:hypothetical protein
MDPATIRELVNDWCEYAARHGCTGSQFERGVTLIESDPDYYGREGLPTILRDAAPQPVPTPAPYIVRV